MISRYELVAHIDLTSKNTLETFVWFDCLRGLCAIAVCAGHLRAAMFVDFGATPNKGWFEILFYASTGLAHQAVIAFFVLSGFFVGGTILRARLNFGFSKYFISRLVRLWIVLIPALVVTFLVDQFATKSLAPEALRGDFYTLWSSGPESETKYSAALPTFIANLLFLQTIVAPVFASNGPLWSLANEFWYYMLFPCITIAVGVTKSNRPSQYIKRASAALFALAIVKFMPSGMLNSFTVWCLGLVPILFLKSQLIWMRGVAFVCGFVGTFFALIYTRNADAQLVIGVSSDYILGIAICALMIGCSGGTLPTPCTRTVARVGHFFSKFSYSLYLTHFPLVTLIGATIYGHTQVALEPLTLAQFIGWMVCLLTFAYLFWWTFERHTDYVRNVLTRALLKRKKRFEPPRGID